jgi:hypothetical protein
MRSVWLVTPATPGRNPRATSSDEQPLNNNISDAAAGTAANRITRLERTIDPSKIRIVSPSSLSAEQLNFRQNWRIFRTFRQEKSPQSENSADFQFLEKFFIS